MLIEGSSRTTENVDLKPFGEDGFNWYTAFRMKKSLARVLALILTVLPWVSVLAAPRVSKAESALVGPLQPEPHQVSQSHPSTPPTPGFAFLEFWQKPQNVRVSLEHAKPQNQSFVENARDWFFLHARLQLDGG
jgi:hypothetical protein